MKTRLNFKYSALQGFYWSIFCSVVGYASVFLLSRGFENKEIGILMAWANLISAILQPMVSSVADKSKKLTLIKLILIISILGLSNLIILFFFSKSFYLVAALYFSIIAISSVLLPLINTVGMYYSNKGFDINFGLARGIGSLAYAAISYVLGNIIDSQGEKVIIITSMVLYFLFIAVLISLSFIRVDNVVNKHRSKSESLIKESYIIKYKSFSVLLIGVVALFIFHNYVNTYLIQIMKEVGGDNSDMGTSIAIAAICELPAMFFFSKLLKKVRVSTLLRVSATIFIIKAVAIYLSNSVAMIHFSQLLQAGSFALFIPASVCYTNELMGEEDKIKGQGFLASAMTAGGVIGSLLGGYILDNKGVSFMLFTGIVFTIVGALLFFVSTKSRNYDLSDMKNI